jgi:hypothetical protein
MVFSGRNKLSNGPRITDLDRQPLLKLINSTDVEMEITERISTSGTDVATYKYGESIKYLDLRQKEDRAPARFHNQVRSSLARLLPNQWTGCEGPGKRPPRSPNLIPMELFLHGIGLGLR